MLVRAPAELVEREFLRKLLGSDRWSASPDRVTALFGMLATAPRLLRMLQEHAELHGQTWPDESDPAAAAGFLDEFARCLRDRPESVIQAYRSMSLAQARDFVRLLLEVGPAVSSFEPAAVGGIIAALSVTGHDRLNGLHRRILDSGLMVPPVVARGAPDDVRAWLVDEYLRGRTAFALPLLWIEDDRVCEVLCDTLDFEREDGGTGCHAHRAGWEPRREGGRRLLHLETALELTRAPDDQAARDAPVRALVPGKDMRTLYLFDFDLSRPETACLELEGARLRIPLADEPDPVFWRLDLDAGAAGPYDDAARTAAPMRLRVKEASCAVAGEERATAYEAAFGLRPVSQLGGLPAWCGEPAYPECPECGDTMGCLGQVELAELAPAEQRAYGFICPDCDIAATLLQRVGRSS